MDKIDNFLSRHSKYVRLQKPLEAARICETARKLANGRYDVLSFRDGLLTLIVPNSARANNLQAESYNLIKNINQELGQELVKNFKFKIQ